MEKVSQLINNYKYVLGFLIAGLFLILTGFLSSSEFKQFFHPAPKSYPSQSLVNSTNLSQIKIDVAGAVNKPGVYSINQGSRVEDAVKIAGGFSTNANYQYISKNINLSQKISDGQKVYIPFAGENNNPVVTLSSSGQTQSGVVGINSADAGQLDSLPGIGPVTSAKIIAGRPYGALDELVSKKVVSKSVFDKIKDQISLD